MSFRVCFVSSYSVMLTKKNTIVKDKKKTYLNKFSFKNKIMQNNCWIKIWTFRPFFLVMLLLWLKFVSIPILTYVVYLWLWFLAIFDPYLRPPNPMAPLHIFDPLGPNNYIHPLKALVLWSLLQKSLCSVRTFFYQLKTKVCKIQKIELMEPKNERIMPILKGFFPILVFKYQFLQSSVNEKRPELINIKVN